MLKLMKGEKHLGRARSLLSYDYLGESTSLFCVGRIISVVSFAMQCSNCVKREW